MVSLFIALWGQPLWAGSILLNKVAISLDARHMVDTIIVRNVGSTPADIQAQAMSWVQENGQDIYQPSQDLIVSPPIMRIAPGKQQIMRVGTKRPAANNELAYRVYLQDITPATTTPGLVQIRLRLGVPVYVAPTVPVVYQAQWHLAQKDGNYRLEITNTGNVHIRLLRVRFINPETNQVTGVIDDSLQLLAGQKQYASFRLGTTLSRRVKIAADTDKGPLTAEISI